MNAVGFFVAVLFFCSPVSHECGVLASTQQVFQHEKDCIAWVREANAMAKANGLETVAAACLPIKARLT